MGKYDSFWANSSSFDGNIPWKTGRRMKWPILNVTPCAFEKEEDMEDSLYQHDLLGGCE